MKKIIPILLTLLLIVGLLPVSAFAAEEKCDIFEREAVTSKKSEGGLFLLNTFEVDASGWSANYNYPLTIRAVDGKKIITRIEAKVAWYGWNYGNVIVSSGNKEQNDEVANNSIVSVSDINASEFSFTCSNGWIQFSEITVYYKDNDGGVGSILSHGYPEIIFGVGGLAVGFLVAMLIFRKKKVDVSSTSAGDKE